LLLDDWKKMDDIMLKYEPITFDRLRAGDPKLKDDKEWNRFMETVIMPARKIDIPDKKYNN